MNCPRTSSMGRLFDAVAALCGFGQEMTFEGQAAMNLEFAAEEEITESYSIPLRASEGGLIADWEPMVRQILAERLRGELAGRISARFHNALAGWPSTWPERSIAARSCSPAVVSKTPG